ncbi:MAG: hypothetical protein R2838_06990 [Caldilineaceae bacterium]
MIDRSRPGWTDGWLEVPVGFGRFVDGLISGDYGFGGEESAGVVPAPGRHRVDDRQGRHYHGPARYCRNYRGHGADPRRALPGTDHSMVTRSTGGLTRRSRAQRDVLKNLIFGQCHRDVAGGRGHHRQADAPGNDAPIGGLKVTTENGWFGRFFPRGRRISTRSTPRVSRAKRIWISRTRPRPSVSRLDAARSLRPQMDTDETAEIKRQNRDWELICRRTHGSINEEEKCPVLFAFIRVCL